MFVATNRANYYYYYYYYSRANSVGQQELFQYYYYYYYLRGISKFAKTGRSTNSRETENAA